MADFLRYPPIVLAMLGAISGLLGTYALGLGYGDAPHPGIYMVLTGLWFGLVVGFGIWRFANRSPLAAAIAVAITWIAWEVAVNLAMQITQNWLKAAGLSEMTTMYVGGAVAGAVGAFLTWAGAAAVTPSLRRRAVAGIAGATGALFGLLLYWTNHFDDPILLLLPWQSAVAAVLGLGLASGQESHVPPTPWQVRRT